MRNIFDLGGSRPPPTRVLRAGSITPILTEVITISAMAAAIWRAAIAIFITVRTYHDRAHHGRNHHQRPYSGYGRWYRLGRGHHHHDHTHYPDRVVVYRERSDDFYKWVGGAFLAGEIIHHTRD